MAAKQIPSTFRKLVATRMSNKFREVASIVSVDTPKPGDGEILVKNRYVGINASDINFSAGRYDPNAKFPLDCGFEALGEVVSTGPNSSVKVGQAVMYLTYGAFADYKIVEAKRAVPVPEMNPEFLPYILSGNTATISLDKVGEIKKGETVLVTAAAGGTGQIAVQWAKLAGCHVIGTCSTDDKVEFLKKIGCDRPVNYKKENLKEVLKKEYPKGIDVVYETIGGEMFDTCVNSLAQHGRLILIGIITTYQGDTSTPPPVSPELARLPLQLLRKSASVRGFMLPAFAENFGEYVMKQITLYKSGKLAAATDFGEKTKGGRFVGLERIPDAVEYLFSQKSVGKIVVELSQK